MTGKPRVAYVRPPLERVVGPCFVQCSDTDSQTRRRDRFSRISTGHHEGCIAMSTTDVLVSRALPPHALGNSAPARRLRAWVKTRIRGFRRTIAGCQGFTLLELAIVVMILAILMLVGIQELRRPREQALLAACISYHVALNRSLWASYAEFGDFPNTLDGIIDNMSSWALTTEFEYAGGEDANKGHGNDWDGNDKDNPGGKTDPTVDNAGYYLRCGHDHSYLRVLFVDSGAYLPAKAIYDLADAQGEIPNGGNGGGN